MWPTVGQNLLSAEHLWHSRFIIGVHWLSLRLNSHTYELSSWHCTKCSIMTPSAWWSGGKGWSHCFNYLMTLQLSWCRIWLWQVVLFCYEGSRRPHHSFSHWMVHCQLDLPEGKSIHNYHRHHCDKHHINMKFKMFYNFSCQVMNRQLVASRSPGTATKLSEGTGERGQKVTVGPEVSKSVSGIIHVFQVGFLIHICSHCLK